MTRTQRIEEAARELLACADALVYRPMVDDSQQIDRDTRALRSALSALVWWVRCGFRGRK